jgi:hypothetical protein
MAYNPGAGSGGQVAGSSGFNQNIESVGLNTVSVTVPYAGPYFVKGKVFLPTLVDAGIASSVVITVNQNGSPVYTGLAGAEGFYVDVSCAANDILAVVPSSGVSTDALANAVKLRISIGQGQ